MHLRPARQAEAAELDRIAQTAKSHWGYSPTQLAAWLPELRTDPATIGRWPTCVAELEGQAVGFAQLDPTPSPWELVSLWVLPGHMGRGIGRALLAAMVDAARAGGVAQIHIDADPNAAAFYRACGAVQTASVPAPISGAPDRVRPQFRLGTG